MTPLVRNEEMNITQAEKRPMAQHIGLGSFILGAIFLVSFGIIAALAN